MRKQFNCPALQTNWTETNCDDDVEELEEVAFVQHSENAIVDNPADDL